MSLKNTTKDDSLYSEEIIQAIEKLALAEKALENSFHAHKDAKLNLHIAHFNRDAAYTALLKLGLSIKAKKEEVEK